MTQFRKAISGLLTLSTALTMTGLGLVQTTYGQQLTNASATLSNPRPTESSTYTIVFNTASADDLREVHFDFRRDASGNDTPPTGFSAAAATLDFLEVHTDNDNAASDWTLQNNANKAHELRLTRNGSALEDVPAATTFTVRFGSISNPGLNANCDVVTGSESCFIRIRTYSDEGTTMVDNTTITYTVTDAVTVTATIDPILTFTVNGVDGASLAGNDSNAGSGTPVTTTSTVLPFGNVTVGTPKMAQQRLRTQTNANGGYTVSGKFANTGGNDSKLMYGNADNSNVISKFTGNTASWANPGEWLAPDGNTQNINSAWLGVRTNDTADLPNFNFSNRYAPPDIATDTGAGKPVMTSSGPDNGTSSVYVTFKIEANAFQPADSYTGTWVYNVVAHY